MGVYEPPKQHVALFASSKNAKNGRSIDDEDSVARALARLVAIERPQLQFLHVNLESLSYANEIRLLRRTMLFVALFGSGLHNCRFLPAGAVVIQIYGALKGESMPCFYYEICHVGVGLGFASYVPRGWDAKLYKSEDAVKARIDIPALLRVVNGSLNGESAGLWRDFLGEAGHAGHCKQYA